MKIIIMLNSPEPRVRAVDPLEGGFRGDILGDFSYLFTEGGTPYRLIRERGTFTFERAATPGRLFDYTPVPEEEYAVTDDFNPTFRADTLEDDQLSAAAWIRDIMEFVGITRVGLDGYVGTRPVVVAPDGNAFPLEAVILSKKNVIAACRDDKWISLDSPDTISHSYPAVAFLGNLLRWVWIYCRSFRDNRLIVVRDPFATKEDIVEAIREFVGKNGHLPLTEHGFKWNTVDGTSIVGVTQDGMYCSDAKLKRRLVPFNRENVTREILIRVVKIINDYVCWVHNTANT